MVTVEPDGFQTAAVCNSPQLQGLSWAHCGISGLLPTTGRRILLHGKSKTGVVQLLPPDGTLGADVVRALKLEISKIRNEPPQEPRKVSQVKH